MKHVPNPGDVVITSIEGQYFLSVVPNPYRISFNNLKQATNIANQWARANQTPVWLTHDSQTFELLRAEAAGS